MTTTSTTSFDLDLVELIEEAWERATGDEIRTGYELRTARRSLNLLTIEWQNRGLNMWTLDEELLPLVAGTATYALGADTVDVVDSVLRKGVGASQNDRYLTRISSNTYARQTNKNQTGEPTQILVRRVSPQQVTFWPVPDTSDYTLYYWRMRRIQDAGDGANTQDVPFRFMPALVAGLAYYIGLKVPDAAPRLQSLQTEYEKQYDIAAQEDREKASWRIVPSGRRG